MKNKINSYSKVGNLNNMRNQLPNNCDKQPGIQSEACLIFSLSARRVFYDSPAALHPERRFRRSTLHQDTDSRAAIINMSTWWFHFPGIHLKTNNRAGTAANAWQATKMKRSGFRHIALNLISCRRAPCIKHLQRRKLIRGVARFLFPLSPQTINCVFKKAAAAWWGSSSKATPHIQEI